MTAQVHQTSGSDYPSITKLLPFQHLILLQTSDRSCSLLQSPTQDTDISPIRIDRPSSKGNALISTRKRRMSMLRNKGTKKPVTILHAVPETTACATALLLDQRDTTAHHDQDVSNNSQITSGYRASSTPLYNETPTPRYQNTTVHTVSSHKPHQVVEPKSVSSNTSLRGAIGTYKHGKIQWRQKECSPSENETRKGNFSGANKNSRPKIQVVIPRGSRERPLPAIPFFSNSNKSHIATASIQGKDAHEVSPPSAGTKVIMRNSVVSPLNQTQPISFGQFQRSMSRVVRKTSVRVPGQRQHASKPSGSSIDSRDSSDSASTYSNHSSETSIEPESPPMDEKHTRHYSVQNPIAAGVFDSSPESLVKQFTPPSTSPPRRYAHHPSTEHDQAYQPTCPLQRTGNVSGSITRQPTVNRRSSKHSNRRQSLALNNGVIDRAISRSTSRQLSNPLRGPSPTLSEAENDLEEQLTCLAEDVMPTTSVNKEEEEEEEEGLTALTEDSPFMWDEVMKQNTSSEFVGQLRKDSATVDMTNLPPPALPRKSSKRQSSAITETNRLSRAPRDHVASQMDRGRSRGPSQRLTLTIPEFRRVTEEPQLPATSNPPKQVKRTITPTCAEGVILNIFRSLDHFDDLFATAVVNQGFHRVFKRHELDLIKSTLRKMSPPAWEFREIAFPGHNMLHDEDLEMTRPQEEYTPTTYLQLQKHDINTIRAIKILIKEKCQSFVRPEIAIALDSSEAVETARIDDALWRIWTFCKIFGSGRGREEDIVAQQDWLRGGVMVHQQACTFSIMSTDYMSDTLVGAPECFAKGNEDGLTAEQLFDMMELWNCLGVLLQGFEGRTAQAREYGIYDNTDIRGGDIDGEEAMLDEWCYYLLTFGLSTVLELAGPCRQMNATPFKVAAQEGWTNWNPPVFNGTRRNFLKEAASRVYEDKIARTYATTSTRDIQRHLSKQRIQNHITELRLRKTNGPRMPMIRMSQERPMSEWSTVIGNLTRPRPTPSPENDIVSHIPTFRSALGQELTTSIAELPSARTPPPPSTRSSSPRRTVAQPLLPSPPPSTVPSTRDRNSIAMSMPSIEEHPAYHKRGDSIPAVPSLSNHPAFRQHNPVPAPLQVSQPHVQQQYRNHSRQSSNDSQHSGEHPAFQQHATQHDIYASAAHENTAEKAIYRIVEMGFTADQAREALRMTDLGDGLRVDRAVELLLTRGG